MHYSKLIPKELTLGIIAKKLNKVINWAAFVEKTNTNQCSKYFKQMNNMEVERKDLMKASKVLWLKRDHKLRKILMPMTQSLKLPQTCVYLNSNKLQNSGL